MEPSWVLSWPTNNLSRRFSKMVAKHLLQVGQHPLPPPGLPARQKFPPLGKKKDTVRNVRILTFADMTDFRSLVKAWWYFSELRSWIGLYFLGLELMYWTRALLCCCVSVILCRCATVIQCHIGLNLKQNTEVISSSYLHHMFYNSCRACLIVLSIFQWFWAQGLQRYNSIVVQCYVDTMPPMSKPPETNFFIIPATSEAKLSLDFTSTLSKRLSSWDLWEPSIKFRKF